MTAHYDLRLFQELNDEYRARPLVPAPPGSTTADYQAVAQRRLQVLSRYVTVEGKSVLELGTGRGYTAAAIAAAGAREVIGVDVRPYDDWSDHDARATRFIVGDLASDDALIASESIDTVVSAVVFEHVTRPVRMLEALHRVLRPGGEAWLYFNLYRGPKASHRYRHIYFPWPHLLFEDAVSASFLADLGLNSKFAWVNRMTAAEYLQVAAELGFSVVDVRRHVARIDEYVDFYVRFEDKLGRYPALDLETDFMTLVLRKSDIVTEPPTLGYAQRQRAFDAVVEDYRTQQAGAGTSRHR